MQHLYYASIIEYWSAQGTQDQSSKCVRRPTRGKQREQQGHYINLIFNLGADYQITIGFDGARCFANQTTTLPTTNTTEQRNKASCNHTIHYLTYTSYI